MLNACCHACLLLKQAGPQQVYDDRRVRVLLARGDDGSRELYVVAVEHLEELDAGAAHALAGHVRKVARWAHRAMEEAGFAFALDGAQMDNADSAGHPHLRLRAATKAEQTGVHRRPEVRAIRRSPRG